MQAAAAELDALKKHQERVRLLEVCQAELRALKPTRAVYEKRGSLFFLSSKEAAQAHVQGKQQEALASLQDVGGKGADRQSLNF